MLHIVNKRIFHVNYLTFIMYENEPSIEKLLIRKIAVSNPSLRMAKNTNKNKAKLDPATAVLTELSISFLSLTCLASQKIT